MCLAGLHPGPRSTLLLEASPGDFRYSSVCWVTTSGSRHLHFLTPEPQTGKYPRIPENAQESVPPLI